MSTPWRVMLVDDHSVVRAGLKHLLDSDERVTVVGEAANATEAVARAAELKPDLIVLDITMPGASGRWVCMTGRPSLASMRRFGYSCQTFAPRGPKIPSPSHIRGQRAWTRFMPLPATPRRR